MNEQNQTIGGVRPGMTRRQAQRAEFAIIGLCVIALVMNFQPFFMILFSVGAGLIVLAVFVVVIGLAIGSVKLSAIYRTR